MASLKRAVVKRIFDPIENNNNNNDTTMILASRGHDILNCIPLKGAAVKLKNRNSLRYGLEMFGVIFYELSKYENSKELFKLERRLVEQHSNWFNNFLKVLKTEICQSEMIGPVCIGLSVFLNSDIAKMSHDVLDYSIIKS